MKNQPATKEIIFIGGSIGEQLRTIDSNSGYELFIKPLPLIPVEAYGELPLPSVVIEYEHYVRKLWRFGDGKLVGVMVLEGMSEDAMRPIMERLRRHGAF